MAEKADDQTTEVSQSSQSANHEHETQLWQMRWFFAIVTAIWIPTAMAVTVAVFCLTKNPYSLSLFSTLAPPVYFLHRFARYVLMDERIFELEKMKIQGRIEKLTAARSKDKMRVLLRGNPPSEYIN